MVEPQLPPRHAGSALVDAWIKCTPASIPGIFLPWVDSVYEPVVRPRQGAATSEVDG